MSRRIRGKKHGQTRLTYRTHPTDGQSSGLTIEGEASQVKGLIQTYAGTGAETNYEESDGFGRLEVSWPNGSANGTPEQPVNTWDVDGNDLQKDLFEHWRAQALGQSVINDVQEKLSKTTAADRDSVSIPSGDATALYERYRRGQTAFYVGSPVLKKTMTVSPSYYIPLSLTGMGKVWHGGSIIATEPTMYLWVRDAILKMHDAYDNGDIEPIPDGYVFGWLKKWPTISQRWGQKVELTQEWWGAVWDVSFTYGQEG